ncbi:hypothetical protein Tco_0437868 [Tanacetum coccineum]
MDWRTNALKYEMPVEGSYSVEDVAILNTRHTPIQKQPEALLCLVGLSRRYFLRDDVYPTFLYDDDRGGCFDPNPSKVKTGTRPYAAHEVPLLTVTASRVIEMEDPAVTTESLGTPSTIEKPPLDFTNENPSQQITEGDGTEDQVRDEVSRENPPEENPTTTRVVSEMEKEVAIMGACSTREGKSLASMGLEAGSIFSTPAPHETPADVSDPDLLSYAKPQSIPERDIAQSSKGAAVKGDLDSEKSTSFTSLVGSPGNIYQPGWGVTNSCRLNTLDVCQDVVDHIAPPGYFSELRHLPNDDFLSQYNINLARQVAMGFQLRLRENKIKNLQALLEVETDIKKVAKAKNAELVKELESLRAQFTDLQVSNDQLSQQVFTLQAQVMGEERIKAAFKEFKKYEDDKVEQRCAEMDARLDKLSVDFDEELYPHMLTAIAGYRWVIGHGLRLAVMKCAESSEIR